MSTNIHPADPEEMANATPAKDGRSAARKAGDAATRARDTTIRTAQDTAEVAQDTAKDIRTGLAKAGDKAREVTEKQPLAAVAGALAVGVLIGLAVNKKRH